MLKNKILCLRINPRVNLFTWLLLEILNKNVGTFKGKTLKKKRKKFCPASDAFHALVPFQSCLLISVLSLGRKMPDKSVIHWVTVNNYNHIWKEKVHNFLYLKGKFTV